MTFFTETIPPSVSSMCKQVNSLCFFFSVTLSHHSYSYSIICIVYPFFPTVCGLLDIPQFTRDWSNYVAWKKRDTTPFYNHRIQIQTKLRAALCQLSLNVKEKKLFSPSSFDYHPTEERKKELSIPAFVTDPGRGFGLPFIMFVSRCL